MAHRPEGQQRELILLSGAVVLAMSSWFSTSAVLDQLRDVWLLTDGQAAWLIVVVQIGFVSGALLSTIAKLSLIHI